MASSENLHQLIQMYDFKWDVLDAIIGGKSMIDLQGGLSGFYIRGVEDADRFLTGYGFNMTDPVESAEALGYFHESLNFIRKHFLQPDNPDGLKLEIPRKIVEITDVRDLILMSTSAYPGQTADTQGMLLKNWSCSILKVMHTISFIDKDFKAYYFSTVQQQILDRFYKLIHRDDDGNLFLCKNLDDPLRVSLVAFETKPKKSRESALLKLLHKPENVAEDLFDQVGLRFVTHDRVSALRVVKYLKDEMAIMPGYVKPSRSRNSLVNIDGIKKELSQLLDQLKADRISEKELKERLSQLSEPESTSAMNPHSSEFYRAIQFTCRQLIKIRNPIYDDLKKLKGLTKQESLPDEAVSILNKIDFKNIQREIRLFFPFEIQIFDQDSAEEARMGLSSHVEYKKSQVQTALKRVMGHFINGPGN